MHKGSCLCGKVAYQAGVLQGPYVYCHCSSCRKGNGSAFAANIAVPIEEFSLVQGEAFLQQFESSPGKRRFFCGNCGSPLFTKVGADPKFVRVRLGTLDTDFSDLPIAHIFVEEKAPWHTIDDAASQFQAWPTRESLKIPGSRQT